MNNARLSHIIYYVDDVVVAADFYIRAFGFTISFLHESNQYVELDTGSTKLAFASHDLGAYNLSDGYLHSNITEKPFGVELVCTVDDVHASFEHAKNMGAIEIAPPKEKPWGQTVAYVRDPQGIIIEIASELV